MKAEIIAVGNEILQGFTLDTNSNFLAKRLTELSFSVEKITVIQDKRQDIIQALDSSIGHCDLILMTGGLGPTSDDITKEVLAEYFGGQLVENKDVLSDIEKLISSRNLLMNEKNQKQALVPDNCIVVRNKNGTAPAMIFNKNNTYLVSMPGVPFEMKEFFENDILLFIKENINLTPILVKVINVFGIAESVLAEKLTDFEKNLPENIVIAYLPAPEGIRLKLTGKGSNFDDLNTGLDKLAQNLKMIISDNFVGFDDDTIEIVPGKLLKEKKLTVSTAESCTGGLIAHKITSQSGSSEYFKGSIVSYSNEAKINILGVNPRTLEEFGAVSKQTVEEMATGAIRLFKTDYAVAVSGIAGPTGGTETKPVGTTWIAVASKNKVESFEFHFGKLRDINIRRAAANALFKLLNVVKSEIDRN